MRSIVKSVAFACASLVLAGTAQAADGVLLVMKTTPEGGTPQTTQVQIEARRMRAEAIDATGQKQIAIFDGTKKVLMAIDDRQKTYIELTEAELDALGAQLAGMSAQMTQMQEQMKQAMASMPPEQRAQMEAAMRGRGMAMPGAGGAAAKVQYTKTGTGTVGKWACDKYEGTSGGQKVSEVCAADPKALGFTAADFEVSRELAAFFKKLMPSGGAQMFSIGTPAEQGFNGVPVRTVSTSGGKQVTTEITDVTRQAFPDSVFQAPAGYTKQDMMGGRGRGRGRGDR